MHNIVCVKAGTKYGPEYVNKLYSMSCRQFTLPFRFVCLTDDNIGVRPEVECLPLPDHFRGVWNKISLYRPEIYDLEGSFLFMDLDVILVDNMDGFFTHPGDFCIGIDWVRKYHNLQSSIFRLKIGHLPHVYERFKEREQEIMGLYRGDQGWISEQIKEWSPWPDGWTVSFKHHCRPTRFRAPKIPFGAKIVNFHGIPKPPEALLGRWTNQKGKHVRRRGAKWIARTWV